MVRVIAFGAHPDDCPYVAAGVAARWTAAGHAVKFVSLTNGDTGHWGMAGGPLARRRTAEAARGAWLLGVESQVLDNHDGELLPTLENRKAVVRLIREWKADLVLCHRSNDYHPDHRYAGVVVQDAAYLVTIPYFCPDTPHLERNPVFMYYEDQFQKPAPFTADIVVAIDDVIEKKIQAMEAAESQFFEGGCESTVGQMPRDEAAAEQRRRAVRERFVNHFSARADLYRSELRDWYGPKAAQDVKFAEAFEICEYGRRPDRTELRTLFPFFTESTPAKEDFVHENA
jgi:N-acetylglucosamine malate deacetylase 1